MEPSLWNMTSNPGDKFYAMIVAPEGVALPEHPIVEMHAHDKQIQVRSVARTGAASLHRPQPHAHRLFRCRSTNGNDGPC